MNYTIVTMHEIALDKLKAFTDKFIGQNYYVDSDFRKMLKLSTDSMGMVSFVALNQKEEIVGIRITLLPGKLTENIDSKFLSMNKWSTDVESVAYFKSLFVHSAYQNKGVGRALTEKSLEELKKRNTKAVVVHSWLESPGNSSSQYLKAMGFAEVKVHPLFWAHVDYLCSGCKVKPCVCTAVEMIKYL